MEEEIQELPADIESGAGETRVRIIESAAKEFTERGYARATTRRIAAAADVNEVTLFRHFGNKLNLMNAVIEHFSGLAALNQTLLQLEGSYTECLHFLATYLVQGKARNIDIMRMLMAEAHQIPELQQVMMHNMHQRNQAFSAYFQRQVDIGNVREELYGEALAQAFFGMFFVYGNVLHNQRKAGIEPTVPPEIIITQMLDIFVKGTQRTS